MHIIFVSNRLTTAKTITLTPRKLLLAGILFSALILGVSSIVSYLAVRHAASLRLPVLQDLLRVVNTEESQQKSEYLRTMAVRLGEMQAQIMRLDSLGERLARMSGISLQELKLESHGRGGTLRNETPLSATDLKRELEVLAQQVESRTDALTELESQVFEQRVRQKFRLTSLPIDALWTASAFGWRIDPFTGLRAMHEGVDFAADVGTPIIAAAAGMVTMAEYHSEYGNVVEIDHGNGFSTRYAHASKLLVQPGSTVKRGQRVALVGNTGRSTGAHLHFEVRYQGNAQNPHHFLLQAQAGSTALH